MPQGFLCITCVFCEICFWNYCCAVFSITKGKYKENMTEVSTAIGNPLECKGSEYSMDTPIRISHYELWISFWSKMCLCGSFSNLNLTL